MRVDHLYAYNIIIIHNVYLCVGLLYIIYLGYIDQNIVFYRKKIYCICFLSDIYTNFAAFITIIINAHFFKWPTAADKLNFRLGSIADIFQ